MKKPTLRYKCRCDPSFACRHKPLQPVGPLFSQPDGQSLHVLPPSVLVHFRLLSHPPLLPRHSSTSTHASKRAHSDSTTTKPKPLFFKRTQVTLNAYSYPQNDPNQTIHHYLQTFAVCRSVVRPTNWAIAAFMTAHDVDAFAFAVATTVVFNALVHVYRTTQMKSNACE